jgi:hypothetical protein
MQEEVRSQDFTFSLILRPLTSISFVHTYCSGAAEDNARCSAGEIGENRPSAATNDDRMRPRSARLGGLGGETSRAPPPSKTNSLIFGSRPFLAVWLEPVSFQEENQLWCVGCRQPGKRLPLKTTLRT